MPRSYDLRRTPLPLSAVGKVQKNVLREKYLVRGSTLDDVRLLGLPADNPIQQHVNATLGRLAPDAVRVASYNTFYTVLAMVESSMEAAVLPAFVASSDNQFSVHIACLIEPAAPLSFYEITKRGRQENAGVKAFSACLADVMRKAMKPR